MNEFKHMLRAADSVHNILLARESRNSQDAVYNLGCLSERYRSYRQGHRTLRKALAHRLRLTSQLDRQSHLLRSEHKAHMHVFRDLVEVHVLHALKIDEQKPLHRCTPSFLAMSNHPGKRLALPGSNGVGTD